MTLPITAFYTGILAIFALFLSAQAGIYRGKAGASILFGDPVNMELAQRVRRHQTVQGNHRYIGRAAANVDNHRTTSTAHWQTRAHGPA